MSPALIVHVAAGLVGLCSGAVALTVRKGERLHRLFGNIFVVSMLTMAAMALFLAVTIPDWANAPGAMFAFYLVGTGWFAIRRKQPYVGLFDCGAPLLALAIAGVGLGFAVHAANDPSGLFAGKPAPLYAMFAGLALFAAALDVKVIWRGGVSGRQRIARHVWRMSTALFFASGSFFLGQQKVMPVFIQGSPILYLLALAPLILMIFWLIRIRFRNRFTSAAIA